jgi:hypothetical protein
MAVPGESVGGHALVGFAEEALRLEGASGAGDARLGVDDHPCGGID